MNSQHILVELHQQTPERAYKAAFPDGSFHFFVPPRDSSLNAAEELAGITELAEQTWRRFSLKNQAFQSVPDSLAQV